MSYLFSSSFIPTEGFHESVKSWSFASLYSPCLVAVVSTKTTVAQSVTCWRLVTALSHLRPRLMLIGGQKMALLLVISRDKVLSMGRTLVSAACRFGMIRRRQRIYRSYRIKAKSLGYGSDFSRVGPPALLCSASSSTSEVFK